MKMANDLIRIAAAGGCIVVRATDYMKSELERIAAAGVSHNAKLTVKRADALKTSDCEAIAKKNPGNVIFDF